jgi:TolB-like protein
MSKIINLVSIFLLSIILGACSTLQQWQNAIDSTIESVSASVSLDSSTSSTSPSTKLCANDDGTFHTCEDMWKQNKIIEPHPSLFRTDLHLNKLSEYTQQMAAEMQRDVQGMQIDQSIVVASFVHLDSSLQNTNALGIQLAESFINDLQQIGLPVADHKLMGVLDVNGKGDFAFSRNMEQFFNDVNIGYVLTGTMVKNNRGMVVNARLINFTTNKVVASSSKFLPNFMVNGLM